MKEVINSIWVASICVAAVVYVAVEWRRLGQTWALDQIPAVAVIAYTAVMFSEILTGVLMNPWLLVGSAAAIGLLYAWRRSAFRADAKYKSLALENYEVTCRFEAALEAAEAAKQDATNQARTWRKRAETLRFMALSHLERYDWSVLDSRSWNAQEVAQLAATFKDVDDFLDSEFGYRGSELAAIRRSYRDSLRLRDQG